MSTHGATTTRGRSGEPKEAEKGSRGGTRGRPRKESMHERSARLQAEQRLEPETQLIRGRGGMISHEQELIPVVRAGQVAFDRGVMPGSVEHARTVMQVYGEHQLGAALHGYAPSTIRELAANINREYPDAKIPERSNYDERISRITSVLTQGRYSANFPKAARGSSATPKAPRAAAQRSTGAPRSATTRAAPKELIPVVSAGQMRYDRGDKPSAYGLNMLYGSAQLREALSGYTLATLKDMAREVQGHNPGTAPRSWARKASVIDYITEQVSANPRTAETAQRYAP